MNTALSPELDGTLAALVQQYGYPQVLDHLVQISGRLNQSSSSHLTARQILTLPMGERNRLLRASVETALPDYESDLALPPDQRILTADLETGDGLEDDDEANDA